MNNHVSRFLSAVILTACLLWSTTPVDASQSTLSPDQLEKGMTGYGVTVFEGTKRETFPVTVKGVLKNVMPDQDIVLIKANTELLNHTMIMSGMSGSPIYINDHLIGALAYSWPFEKEPIAGVTPIRNIKNARRQGPIQTGKGGPETIRTPIVTSGLNAAVKQDLSSQFSERGLTPKFITGGQSGASDSPPAEPVPSKLRPGAAVGVQLMRGDLSMTAIGTVTHVEGNTVFAFGHPFLGAGNVEFPMTTANVHTYMPSY